MNRLFCLIFLVWGIEYTFGIFLNELTQAFGTSYSSTSGVYSVQMGMLLCVGPIAARLVTSFGCQKTTIAGSVIAAMGLITSGFAQNIATLYLTAGFCTGNFCYPDNNNFDSQHFHQIDFSYILRCGSWPNQLVGHHDSGNLL